MSSNHKISEHGMMLIGHHRDKGLPTPSLDHPPVDSTPIDIERLMRKMKNCERESILFFATGVIAAAFVARETRLTDPAVSTLARTVQADWLDGLVNIAEVVFEDGMQGGSWKLPVMAADARRELTEIIWDWERERSRSAAEAGGGA